MRIFSLLLLALGLTACSNNVENVSPYLKNLKGVWVMTEAKKSPTSVSSLADKKGYVTSDDLRVVGTKRLSNLPSKLYLDFDDKTVNITLVTEENGQKKLTAEKLDFQIINTDVYITSKTNPYINNWEMTWLRPPVLKLKSMNSPETLEFKKSTTEAVANEIVTASLNLSIAGNDPSTISQHSRIFSYTGTVGLSKDPEFVCVQDKDKNLKISVLNNFNLKVLGFDAAAKSAANVFVEYSEAGNSGKFNVASIGCTIQYSILNDHLRVAYSCPNSQVTSEKHPLDEYIEIINMSGSVNCVLETVSAPDNK